MDEHVYRYKHFMAVVQPNRSEDFGVQQLQRQPLPEVGDVVLREVVRHVLRLAVHELEAEHP